MEMEKIIQVEIDRLVKVQDALVSEGLIHNATTIREVSMAILSLVARLR